MNPFKLTDPQLRFFQTFGYLSFPGLMADRCTEIINEFEVVWAAVFRDREGHCVFRTLLDTDSARSWTPNPLDNGH